MCRFLPFKKISWKLTFTYSALFSLVLIVLNACTLYGVRSFMIGQARTQVENSTFATQKELAESGVVNLSDQNLLHEASLNDSINIRITDINDRTLLSSGRFNLDNLSAISNPGTTQIIETKDRHLVLRNEKIVSGGKVVGYLQVAYEMEKEYGFIKLLFVFMAFTDLVGIVLSVLAGVFVSRRVLRPIDRITQTAKNISSSDLNSHIEVGPADDELTRLAVTFNEMIDRLRVSFEKQSRFVSDASHELRTPISVIQSYAELIDRWGKDNPAVLQEAIDTIRQETEDMTALIERLLFLARGDSGSIQLKKEAFDLRVLLQEVVNEGRQLAPNHHWNYQIGGTIQLVADRRLVKQLLRALTDNSIKYTPEDGSITIDATAQGGNVRISVKDTGIGIPQAELANIFDRFYRVDQSRTKESGGSGLGLSIVKSIVEAHGGTVSVQSSEGEGTEVTASFPIYE